MSRRVELIFILFLFSGFGGLIYESIWTHYLKLFLGHSAHAQTLVLVVFIGGLALGAWIVARIGKRLKNPLRWYAAVELAIGAIALVFHPIFVAATDWGYATLLPAACSAVQPNCAAQWVFAALLLLPQSILIGATFPLVSSAVLRLEPSMPGHHIALLYFMNSFGAVLGVLASIFLLIPAFGLPGTLLFVGVGNLALAGCAWLLASVTPAAFEMPTFDEPGAAAGGGRDLVPVLLVTALLTGLSSFVYEIAWIRMLSLVLGASTHAFEIMLASFILGLALGGLWIRRRVDEITDPVRYLGIVQLVMGVAAAATLPIYSASFDVMAWLLSSISRSNGGFLIFNLASTVIALLVMLPATFCAGMTLPLITYRLIRSRSGERALGLVYSVNTLGAIIGVVLAVQWLMPMMGVRGALLVGAAIDVALGTWLVATAGSSTSRSPRWAAAIPAVAALALIATAFDIDVRKSASGVFRSGTARIAAANQVIFHEDGKTATVDVLDDGTVRAIRTNGKSDAAISMGSDREPTGDELTMALLAMLPLAHAPEARHAAIIGFGSGMSTHVMLGSPTIQRVDTIEIETAMVEGAQHFRPVVERAFADPRSRIVLDDAKSYFARGGERYDIIVSEPSNPWVSGVSSLFTEEFYQRLAASLNEGGVLSQWLHTYEMDAVALASIFAAVSKTFPDFVAYSSIDSDIILIARKGKPLGPLDEGVLAWPGMADIVKKLKLGEPEVLRRRALGSAHSIARMFPTVPANSDYYPLVDNRASRTRFTQERVTELSELQAASIPVLEMFDTARKPGARAMQARAWGVADHAAVDAWSFHDAIVGAGIPEGPAPASNSREHGLRLIRLWAETCSPQIPFERLLPTLVTVAQVANPHMAPESAQQIWRKLSSSACAARLQSAEREWLALFDAVARRDAADMARLGASRLEASTQLRNISTEYALAAAVTGLICLGKPDEANRYLERATKLWLSASAPMNEFRYLHAAANPRPQSPPPACLQARR